MVVLIHHAGKGKEQRGTSRREDVLDLVLKLREPEGHDPEDGTKFEVVFEKRRGLVGKAVATFEAEYRTDATGNASWLHREVADTNVDDVLELKNQGQTVRAIAKELGLSKSAVQRILDRCPTP